MAKSTKQSTQSRNTAAKANCATGWKTGLEKKLAKLGQPALLQAFQIAMECSIDFIGTDEAVENARRHPHEFADASFPLDFPAIYDAYELFDIKVCEDAEKNPDADFLPSLDGYIAWLVLSKLWSLYDSASYSAGKVFMSATVTEITGICLLAEHAQRIRNSEYRAIAARKSLTPNCWKHGKQAERRRHKFWDKAEQSLYERHSDSRWMYPSLEAMAMSISETDVIPFDFLECFTILLSFEEQM